MTQAQAPAGYFCSGMPYNRLGHGPRPLLIIQGLLFENKPQSSLATAMYRFLGHRYTVYSVMRKPRMPRGYTFQDMADDYATLVQEEFGGPVDVLGISTGGSLAQQFAADHPELVGRLVIHSSAYTFSADARALQLEVGRLAEQRGWRQAWAALLGYTLPPGPLNQPLTWLASHLMSLDPPDDPSDLIITIEAEDQFNFKDRLAQIAAPTLLAAGERDPFYSPALFRETTAGIPNARLCLYQGMGHPAGGKRFRQDVLAFLRGDAVGQRVHV